MLPENLSLGFLARSDTNWPLKMARSLKFRIQKVSKDCIIYVGKTKALINCVVTLQLIYAFVLAYAKGRISHDASHVISSRNIENCLEIFITFSFLSDSILAIWMAVPKPI